MTKIQVRRGTASAWQSANTTLSSGELGLETDTGNIKVGDGTTAWNSLEYLHLGKSLSFSSAFGTVSAFNGSANVTLDLPSTIDRNAATATKLAATKKINNVDFDGSANVFPNPVIYGTAGGVGASYSAIYASPGANPPASPVNGDVWIAW